MHAPQSVKKIDQGASHFSRRIKDFVTGGWYPVSSIQPQRYVLVRRAQASLPSLVGPSVLECLLLSFWWTLMDTGNWGWRPSLIWWIELKGPNNCSCIPAFSPKLTPSARGSCCFFCVCFLNQPLVSWNNYLKHQIDENVYFIENVNVLHSKYMYIALHVLLLVLCVSGHPTVN